MSAREVFLVGGSPWGFRMHGGHDLRQPLRISRVNPGSKAAQQGMREGDLISSINGKSAGELTNSEAHALLRNAGDTLKLGLNLENTGSPKRHRAHRSSVRESATTEIVRETTTTTTTTAAKTTTTSSTRRVTTESKKTGEANEAKVGQSSIDCRNGGLSARLEVKQRNPAKKSKTRNTLHPVDSQGLCDRSSKLDRKGKEIRMSRGIRKQGKRRGHGRRNARRCPTLVTAVEGMEKPSDSSSKDVEGVAGSQECSKRERCSIERGTTARPVVKVVEISTISSLPLEATVDHIPGVGIVESGAGGSSSEDAIVTISEPTESLRPFTTTSNDGERLEILDVSDHCHSEVTEVETVNANPVVDEADSDTATGETSSELVPRRSTWNLRNSTSEWDSVMPRDVEAELRSFIEGLKLPSHVHDAEEALRRRACKRTRKMHQVALLHSQQSDRFLDSIQEENERISEEKQQQQQVRDFINEEISKFRRKEDVGQLERDLFYCPPAPPNRSSSLPDVPPFQETHSDDPAAPRRPSLPNCQHPLDTRDPKSGVLGNLLTMMGLSSIANSQLLVCFPGTLLGEHRHLPERERGILNEKADAREPTNRLLAIIKENSKKRSRKPTTTTLGVDRERLKVTRLCDWLTSARYEQLVGESCAILENGTVERILPLRRIKDSRYSVNPALIDGKVDERKKTAASSLVAKCVASVDKSCIDTTSIFDQSPPRSHLEPRRHVNGEVETKAKMSAIPVNGEVFRQLMYNEYVDKVLEREKRKQLKTLRLSSPESALKANNWPEKRSACSVEGEFMEKARTRLNRIGIKLDDEEVGKETRLTEKMPKHLQEFLGVSGDDGIWSPNTDPPIVEKERSPDRRTESQKDGEIPAIWTPPSVAASPVSGRKEFRPVPFESPTLSRKKPAATRQQESEGSIKESAAVAVVELTQPPPPPPPWMTEGKKRETSTQDSSGSSLTSRLPRVQNPTITLLQKAREGQLPKGASYLAEREQEEEVSAAKGCLRDGGRPVISPADIIYTVKKEYESEPETENESPRKMVDLGPRKFEGIGPTSKEGIPLVLRSEVKETNQTKWYKKMYDSLHRADRSDDYVTVRYKPTRANRHGYGSGSSSGYLSEPDYRLYSSDLLRSSSTLDNRHCTRNKRNEFSASSTVPRRSGLLRYSPEVYKNQPGRIEDYEPGRSSITEKEAKEWWDEVMDIFDGPFDQRHVSHRPTKPYMAHALKESGYESDSTLVFKRKEDISPLNEFEQRLAYKSVQSGGDVPLHGLRKPAPERPKESPRRYVEGEVTIHYRSPVRTEAKEVLSEEELARRSAENMRRVYQEERRRKYMQELHDIDSRRHTDNFTPSQKSPIPLNRYDDVVNELHPIHGTRSADQTPEPRLVARALYNFTSQSPRELNFRRGDVIFIRRRVDKNWYEGEHNAMIGLFPSNYVEILPYESARTAPKKPYEGQARAKFNFVAQTKLELSLAKGELVILTRRVDENWYEGRIGNRKGIFPVSYVEAITEPGHGHLLTNGSTGGGKTSTAPHRYPLPINANQSGQRQHYNSLPRMGSNRLQASHLDQALHINTHLEPVAYRALYRYRPQNEDELELDEGDTVYVMEKCDDGWYVGSSQRTGCFGTFPGNYVEQL